MWRTPTDEDARRFDRQRKKKRVSNEDWKSRTDPESRITKMKDGRTHLAYKAEHVIDLETEVVLAAPIYPGDAGDTATVETSLQKAEAYGDALPIPVVIEEVVADKGYHATRRWRRVRRWDCGPTSPNRSVAGVAGTTSPPRGSSRIGTTGDGCTARAVVGSNGGAGARRTELRAHLRQREPTADLAPRDRERSEALPAHGRRAQSRARHAASLRDRHAPEPPGARGAPVDARVRRRRAPHGRRALSLRRWGSRRAARPISSRPTSSSALAEIRPSSTGC